MPGAVMLVVDECVSLFTTDPFSFVDAEEPIDAVGVGEIETRLQVQVRRHFQFLREKAGFDIVQFNLVFEGIQYTDLGAGDTRIQDAGIVITFRCTVHFFFTLHGFIVDALCLGTAPVQGDAGAGFFLCIGGVIYGDPVAIEEQNFIICRVVSAYHLVVGLIGSFKVDVVFQRNARLRVELVAELAIAGEGIAAYFFCFGIVPQTPGVYLGVEVVAGEPFTRSGENGQRILRITGKDSVILFLYGMPYHAGSAGARHRIFDSTGHLQFGYFPECSATHLGLGKHAAGNKQKGQQKSLFHSMIFAQGTTKPGC